MAKPLAQFVPRHRPIVSVWTTLKHCHVLAEIHSKVQVGGDKQTEWCMALSFFKPHPFVFLCVSSIHPAPERSLTNTPSLPFHHPPKPSFHHKHTSTTEGRERLGKLSTRFFVFFCSFLQPFFVVVTIYHWIENFLLINTAKKSIISVLKFFVRIKKHVLLPNLPFEMSMTLQHNCQTFISHQPQNGWFYICSLSLSHLCQHLLGFVP